MQDDLRMGKNVVVYSVIKAKDGSVSTHTASNLRTNAGLDWQVSHMLSSAAGVMNQIAITENSDVPASTDTNLAGEETADGLSRTTATLAHTTSQSTATMTASWQYTGSSVKTIAKASMCSDLTDNNSSTDSHFLMTELSPVAPLDSNDTLTINWAQGY